MISAAAEALTELALSKPDEDADLPDIPAVEFGRTPNARINYLSVSQLKTAAPWVEGGCLRKWFLKKVVGLDEPEKGSQALGKLVHAQLEHYMLTGQDVLGEIARAALPYLPKPDPQKLCEESITAANRPEIVGATVEADGIPLVGFIDRIDEKPPRVVDYKTSKNPKKYAAKPEDLATTATAAGIQMVGYTISAEKQLGLVPSEPVELEHTYLHTRPTKAEKAAGEDAKQVIGSLTPLRARVEWAQRIDPLAVTLREVAKAKTLDDVEPRDGVFPNASCESFGGCPFYATCFLHETRNKTSQPTGEKPMSLADILASRRAAAQKAASGPAAKPDAGPSVPDASASSATPVPSAPPIPELVPVVVPPDAPKSDPAKAADPLPISPTTESGSHNVPAQSRRGRKPKNQVADAMIATAEAQEAETADHTAVIVPPPTIADAMIAAVQKTLDAGAPPKLELFVDCVSSRPGVSLASYIAEKLATFTSVFPGLLDIRCAPKKTADGKDHALAFGAWKGVLAAECRMNPPAPGRYFVLGVAQSEIAQVVVEALEPLCAEFTKGVK